MKIFLAEDYPAIKKEYLDYAKHHIFYEKGDIFEKKDIDAIMIRSSILINEDFLNDFSNLKYIFRVGVGLDNIDTEICKEKNIQIFNTPFANAESVADLTLGLMILGSRKMYKNFSEISERFSFMSRELKNLNIAFVGFGNIAQKVYHRLKAFGCDKVLALDPYLGEEKKQEFAGVQFLNSKKEIFEKADILSFHIPLASNTKNFLSGEDFKYLKKNICIINTARGEVVEENSLINFLKANYGAFYGADVRKGEPNKPNEELKNLFNVFLTPHIGAMSLEAEQKMHFFEILKKES